MQNVKQLREELISIFGDLKSDKLDVKKAKELVNCAGKILTTAKLQVNYNQLMDKKERIDFLEQ